MNRYHQKVLEAIDATTNGMSEADLTRSCGDKWTIARTLEHLALAFDGTARVMAKALQAGRPLGDNPSLKQRAMSTLVVDIGYFPRGREAPKMVVPTGKIGGNEALELIRGKVAEMDRLHAECMAKFGHKGFLANHPVLGPLTITQWPKFHWVHTRHHMNQVRARKAAE
jgi:hypothetical protein